jgi:hypothetical protein
LWNYKLQKKLIRLNIKKETYELIIKTIAKMIFNSGILKQIKITGDNEEVLKEGRKEIRENMTKLSCYLYNPYLSKDVRDLLLNFIDEYLIAIKKNEYDEINQKGKEIIKRLSQELFIEI